MSYTNNSLSIIGGAGITVTPSTATGATTITIDTLGPEFLAVRTAIVSPVVVSAATDEVVSVEVPGPVPVTVSIPIGVIGQVFYIKDGLGLASPVNPITISPLASTVDGALTAVINAPYGSLTLVFTGTEWKLL
jgi:hypothetical protein